MASEVVMPKMGYDMTEGTVLAWRKSPGDPVAKGDVLGEIETGKVNIEIEAFDEGVLGLILVGEGMTVPVGTPIAVIVAPGEAVPERYTADVPSGAAPGATAPAETAAAASTAAPDSPQPAGVAVVANHVAPVAEPDEAPSAAPADGRLRASPLARRMAGEAGLDLAVLAGAGSGPGGRVVRDDVLAAVARREAEPAGVSLAAGAAGRPEPATEPERVPLSKMRQTIARRLTESWSAAPHIFVTMAIDMGAALELRSQVNAHLEASGGGKVSVNDLVLKAVAHSLVLEPRMNASFEDGVRVQHHRVHVAVAVALPDGLITLTVPDTDREPLSALAAAMAAKAERARAGKLQPEDLATTGTFTVSNLGMYGVEQFTAILNPPEAGILAVGAAIETPVVRDGAVVVRPIMKVTLSADHRVVDGATAAEFLVHLRTTLENPLSMLV